MPWANVRSRRLPKIAVDQVAVVSLDLIDTARRLLLEHHRDHVKRTGRLECPACVDAGGRIQAAKESASSLLW